MIVVIGHAIARPDRAREALALSLEHVRRSRTEPGCLSHAVHHDAEDAQRIVFVERWADRAALARHFEVPESAEFVRRLAALCTEPPGLSVYSAEEIPTSALSG